MATPRCPYCNAQGINQLEAKVVGFFVLIFCKSCGAIHGVVPKPVAPQPQATASEPAQIPTGPEPELDLHPIPGLKPKPEPQKKKPAPLPRKGRLTTEEAQARAVAGLNQAGTMYRIVPNNFDED